MNHETVIVSPSTESAFNLKTSLTGSGCFSFFESLSDSNRLEDSALLL